MNNTTMKANEMSLADSGNKAKIPLKVKVSQRTSIRAAVPCTNVIY